MKISIIIPCYNRCKYVKESLEYISHQSLQRTENVEIEVIIVDDGSTDSTHEVVQSMEGKVKNLFYLYRERDKHSNVSRARNIGLENASGDIICFLDAGILVPPSYVDIVAYTYMNTDVEKLVLIHYIYGVFVNPDVDDMSSITDLNPQNIRIRRNKWSLDVSWIDVREGLFNLVEDDLDMLPAPWTLGWSGAISLPRILALEVKGFDCNFHGWGAEDQDFSYRLFREGASFRASRDAFALHLPHPSLDTEEKRKSSKENTKLLHKKNYQLDTEMFYLYNGATYQQFLSKLNNLVIIDLLPEMYSYPKDFLDRLYLNKLSLTKCSLLIGVDTSQIARQINTTHIFAHNKSTYNRFKREFPFKSVEYLFGCDTFYENQYFDLIIFTDYIRIFGEKVLGEILVESKRIGKELLLLTTSNINISRIDDSNNWVETSKLEKMVNELDVNFTFMNFNGTSF